MTAPNRALLFQRACRRAYIHPRAVPSPSPSRHTSTDSSPFDPSQFTKPLRLSPSSPNQVLLTTTGQPPYATRAARPRAATQVLLPHRENAWTLTKRLFGWKPSVPEYEPAPFTGLNNPYRARKKWPPEFADMHPKQQFHFEKTYRRRAKMVYTRPQWNRVVRMLSHTLVVTVLIYFIFICEPQEKQGTPFDGFRRWFFGKMKNLDSLPDEAREEARRLEEEAREQTQKRRTIFG